MLDSLDSIPAWAVISCLILRSYLNFLGFNLLSCNIVLIIVPSLWSLWRMNSGMHAENINQYIVRSKDSVNVSHTVIPLLFVFFFQMKISTGCWGAFPDTGSCLFLCVKWLRVLQGLPLSQPALGLSPFPLESSPIQWPHQHLYCHLSCSCVPCWTLGSHLCLSL